MSDYEQLHRALASEILKQEGKLGKNTAEFVAGFVAQLRAKGWKIGDAEQQQLNAWLTSTQAGIAAAIESALTVAASAGVLSHPEISKLSSEAFSRQWPDGLSLSKRLWAWEKGVTSGLTDTLNNGIKLNQSVGKTLYQMQRLIEREHGKTFKIVEQHKDDWVKGLHEAAQNMIHNPDAKALWEKTMHEAIDRIDGLKESGTKHAAQRVLDQMRQGVEKGSEALIDNAAKWWMYDKQLYHLKRIIRTEMADAGHQAVIAGSEQDESIIGYQWRLSGSHPVTDICDYYANIEMGLGKGVWPKGQVPRHKAHPHCMCLIIPRVTQIKARGSKNYAQFLQKLPPEKQTELMPQWAGQLNNLGLPLEKLMRKDGKGLLTREQLRRQWGDDKFNAATLLSKALTEKQWPQNKLKLKMPQTKATLASLQKNSHIPEVRQFLESIEQTGYQADSRLWHYFRYKYHFNDAALASPAMLDQRFGNVLLDKASSVHLTNSGRYAVISEKAGYVALVHSNGQRITVYDYNATDIQQFGAPSWSMQQLIT